MSDRAKYLRKPGKIYPFNILRIISFLIVFSSHTMWTKCNATWGRICISYNVRVYDDAQLLSQG